LLLIVFVLGISNFTYNITNILNNKKLSNLPKTPHPIEKKSETNSVIKNDESVKENIAQKVPLTEKFVVNKGEVHHIENAFIIFPEEFEQNSISHVVTTNGIFTREDIEIIDAVIAGTDNETIKIIRVPSCEQENYSCEESFAEFMPIETVPNGKTICQAYEMEIGDENHLGILLDINGRYEFISDENLKITPCYFPENIQTKEESLKIWMLNEKDNCAISTIMNMYEKEPSSIDKSLYEFAKKYQKINEVFRNTTNTYVRLEKGNISHEGASELINNAFNSFSKCDNYLHFLSGPEMKQYFNGTNFDFSIVNQSFTWNDDLDLMNSPEYQEQIKISYDAAYEIYMYYNSSDPEKHFQNFFKILTSEKTKMLAYQGIRTTFGKLVADLDKVRELNSKLYETEYGMISINKLNHGTFDAMSSILYDAVDNHNYKWDNPNPLINENTNINDFFEFSESNKKEPEEYEVLESQ